MRQLQNIAALPWTFKHVAVMPDAHYGKGATVGSVIAMRDAVSQAAVGVDIGCGMTAVRTTLKANDLPADLSRLRSNLERAVPVGFGQHKATAFNTRDAQDWDHFWRGFEDLTPAVKARKPRNRQPPGATPHRGGARLGAQPVAARPGPGKWSA
jgi:tRNA-splicing ligase RtcB